MKIAMVFDGLGFGGIERVGVQYAKILEEMGHQVDVYNLKPQLNALENELPSQCATHPFAMSSFSVPEYYVLMAKRWWWGKYAYPLAHIAIKLALYARRLLFKIARKGEGDRYDLAIAFSGHFNDLAFVRYRFVNARHMCCWLHGALMEYLVSSYSYGDLYRKIKNLVVLSEDRQPYALQECAYLKDELNIVKICNPVDMSSRTPDEGICQKLRDAFGDYLLMVGRLDSDKDQATVIRARKILEEKYNLTPHVIFVGDGSRRAELEQLTASLGLSDAVHFEGSHKDVENYYSTAKIFVHSSPAEGLPTTLIEALSYSLPIVATDSPPGVNEILGSNEYGLKCRVADSDDMAEKLASMLTDDVMQSRYRTKTTERARCFSVDSAKEELTALFRNLK